jgi:two-component system response regulator HupR/HoxA
MQQVRKMIERIAPANVPVYIFGASGTGKELAARAIHSQSERKSKPFVAVNCGALPSKLLAGELFGHKKGAFTGAVADRPGLFKVADKGTLFLDEVSDMDKEMQTHLLRVLQDGTFRSLGDNEELSVDVRILAASNRDLEEEVKAGRFREDLFYRLNVVRIDLPLLKDRREDIPLLVEFLVRRHAKGKTPSRFTKEAIDLLTAAEWPGNIRELENEILRAVTMAGDQNAVGQEDLSPRFHASSRNDAWNRSGLLKDRVRYFEETVIRRTVSELGNNASKAARALGISRATLYKKLEK